MCFSQVIFVADLFKDQNHYSVEEKHRTADYETGAGTQVNNGTTNRNCWPNELALRLLTTTRPWLSAGRLKWRKIEKCVWCSQKLMCRKKFFHSTSKLPYVLFWGTVYRLLDDTSRRHHPPFLHYHAVLIIEILVKKKEKKETKKNEKEAKKKKKQSFKMKHGY